MTLVELLVVLTIIGMIAALAAPNLGAVLRRRSSGNAGERLAGALRVARSEAVRRGKIACFEWNGSSGEFRITLRTTSRDSVLAAGELAGVVAAARSGRGLPPSRACFHPSGVAGPGARWVVPASGAVVEVDAWDATVSISLVR